MTPTTGARTAPDTASGAVPLVRQTAFDHPAARLTERAFWRAVAGTIVPVPRRRQR